MEYSLKFFYTLISRKRFNRFMNFYVKNETTNVTENIKSPEMMYEIA